MTPVFEKTITVSSDAIDSRNHVNNLVYLDWCLKIAEEHWTTKASSESLQKHHWYVLRHTIDYRNAAFLGDVLNIKTWVESTSRVKSERHYVIVRPSDGKKIIEAKTTWCFIDAETQKPALIPEEIRTLFQ